MASKHSHSDSTCKICKKILTTKSNLLLHMKTMHAKDLDRDVFECDFCGLKFVLKAWLHTHLKTKHEDGKVKKFECDLDGKVFDTKMGLRGHMRNHRVQLMKCDICSKEVKGLTQHMQLVHQTEAKLKCEICKKLLNNKHSLHLHMKLHQKAHQCQQCGKRFAWRCDLRKHLLFHEDRFAFRCEPCQRNFGSKDELTIKIDRSPTNVHSASTQQT
jgi:KRAB domain-containing zinc finger protein